MPNRTNNGACEPDPADVESMVQEIWMGMMEVILRQLTQDSQANAQWYAAALGWWTELSEVISRHQATTPDLNQTVTAIVQREFDSLLQPLNPETRNHVERDLTRLAWLIAANFYLELAAADCWEPPEGEVWRIPPFPGIPPSAPEPDS